MSSNELSDHRWFAAAYREHHGRAVRVAHSVLRDRAAAEDVAQDVFAELWSRPHRFDAGRASLSSYVTLLARSRAIDQQRSRRARHTTLERVQACRAAPDAGETPEEAAIRRETGAQITRALSRLPAAQQAAVLLTAACDFSASELARMTGAPLGTAKSRVRLGLRRSRVLLESGT